MIRDNDDLFQWVQSWYYGHCNGDWEHDERFVIENIDNPGWLVSINLEGTQCEGKDFQDVRVDHSEHDWFHCFIREGRFKGAGGPLNLLNILRIFKEWASQYQSEDHNDFPRNN